ncbi:MAG TPA: J domain-containing protein, partial [Brevundimonas sp.]|nr:J domain-containing protein [Brevundimonas sp.]
MRARSLPEVASTREAYALLGLTGPVDGEALTAAFRIAIKAARPEVAGGSEVRFRKTIAAWRLIQRQTAPLALA